MLVEGYCFLLKKKKREKSFKMLVLRYVNIKGLGEKNERKGNWDEVISLEFGGKIRECGMLDDNWRKDF